MKTLLPQNGNIIQNNIICDGKYALPDASLSYCISSSLPHALNIGFYLITKTSKGTIFFIFNIGKHGFRSSLFLSKLKKMGGGLWRNRERKHRCVWPKGLCSLYQPMLPLILSGTFPAQCLRRQVWMPGLEILQKSMVHPRDGGNKVG